MKLSGWGRFPVVDCKLINAREELDVIRAVKENASLIARGNGSSYGDAALNPRATLSMLKMNRFLNFDPQTGVLECEAGVLLSDILSVFVPRGWFPPVTPGTKFVTVGGMIAADVHGKNHHKEGSFGCFVQSLRLVMADGSISTCSREENSDVFHATIGGTGLTGVIASATFRLRNIETAYIRKTVRRLPNLDGMLQVFDEAQDAPYSVAWIDCLSQGTEMGRGVLFTGRHLRRDELPKDLRSNPLTIRPRRTLPVPFAPPISLLSRWLVAEFNKFYYRRQKPGDRVVDYDRFFYPLDALAHWNRIYGRRGFIQFQCVVPKARGAAALKAILEKVAVSGQGSFLAVLKLLGASSRYLSFPMEGYTLALDFPVSERTLALQAELDRLVSDAGGRLYFAKDARASSAAAQSGYVELAAFSSLRDSIGAKSRFTSLLSERAGL
jgi:decaprenylphospho-beta-D-ribofuranose 2-oxidase